MTKKPKDAVLEDLKRVAKDMGRPPENHADYRDSGGKYGEWEFRKRGGMTGALKLVGLSQEKVKVEPGSIGEVSMKLHKARSEIERLKQLNAELQSSASSSEKIRELILGTDRAYEPDTDWLKGARKQKITGTRGMPSLLLSDLHLDEVVDKNQMNGMNEYNREIAIRRIRNVVKGFIELYKHRIVAPKWDGCILNLLGDGLSGNIHEELEINNDFVVNQSILLLEELYIDAISALADEFGRVYVPCIVGNHGRQNKKPRAKNYAWENFEWLVYMHLVRHFKNDSRVAIEVTDATDILYPVYRRFYLAQHGQEFKGGNGIGGIMIPILRGLAKKQSVLAALGKRYDVALMGHFHQYIHTNQLVINSTTKGYDEWTKSMGFSFEPPQQGAWVEHPDYGMVLRTPIFCEP